MVNNNKQINIFCEFSTLKNRSSIFKHIIDVAYNSKLIVSKKGVYEALENREKQESTNFGEGFAISHAQSKYIKYPICFFISFKKIKDMKYDKKGNVKFIICLLFPDVIAVNHIKLLSKISEFLINRNNHAIIYNLEKEKLINQINAWYETFDAKHNTSVLTIKKEPLNSNNIKQQFDIVAVSSCLLGLNKNFLAGKSLGYVANKFGFNFKCEYLTANGVQNELTRQDIANADVVILLLSKHINEQRFFNKKIYRTSTTKAIQFPTVVLNNAVKLAESNLNSTNEPNKNFSLNKNRKYNKRTKEVILNGKSKFNKKSVNDSNTKTRIQKNINFKEKIKSIGDFFTLKGLYANAKNSIGEAISWILPLIVIGGIFLGLSVAIGGAINPKNINNEFNYISFSKKGGVLDVFYVISNSCFALMSAIFGGFIAYGISGKKAFAPAFIVSWTSNLSSQQNSDNNFRGINYTMFNYSPQHLGFGLEGAQLSFIGAIVVGVITGYIANKINSYLNVKYIGGIYSIIFVPLFLTLIVWVIMAFVISVPLTYVLNGFLHIIQFAADKGALIAIAPFIGILICIDLGGPLNKLAFLTGITYYVSGSTRDIGAKLLAEIGAASGVPALGMSIYSFIGRKYHCSDKEDSTLGWIACILGFLGITESAIPYAVKYPRSAFLSNVLGGCIASTIAGVASISNHISIGSFITYIFGGIGTDFENTNYLYGLLYLLAIFVGSIITAVSMLYFTNMFYYKDFSRTEYKKNYTNFLISPFWKRDTGKNKFNNKYE